MVWPTRRSRTAKRTGQHSRVDCARLPVVAYCILHIAAEETPGSLAEAEQKILAELMEVVQQRDALVALLEEDRLK